MRYFKKINPKQALYGSYGQQIAFPDFGNGFGGFATEDPNLIKEFELAMSKSVGGIAEVTEAEFEALKKKLPSSPHSSGEQSVNNLLNLMKRQGTAAANPRAAGRAGTGKQESALMMPSRAEGLLMPSEPARTTGFRPKSIQKR